MRKLIFILMFGFNVVCSAGLHDDVKSCALLSDAERLGCYDAAAGKLMSSSSSEDVSGWEVSVNKNPIDDTSSVVIYIEESGPQVRKRGKTVLAIRCQSDKTSVYVNWGEFLGSDDIKVTTRLDDKKARTVRWDISSNSRAAFHRSPVNFAKDLIGGKQLVVKTMPYRSSPIISVFDLSGVSDAIAPLRQTCGW